MKKLLLGILAAIVVLVGGAATYVLVIKTPKQRPASNDTIASTPERLKRGEYLVEHVAVCTHCHSDPQPDIWGGPGKPGTHGAGGLCLDEKIDFPGSICSSNITGDKTTGIGAWTDGQILRAVREGVNHKGEALFAAMPYLSYRSMSDEDAHAVVAYLRTLAPVNRVKPERRLKPPVNIVVKFMPEPLEGAVAAPDASDKIAYGKYLATLAGCISCHTPVDKKHQPLPGMQLAGGRVFKFPWGGLVRTANLTPHESGLGPRTKENFVALFKAFASAEAQKLPVAPEQNTVMPWLHFAAMTEEDLGAIYDYLRTVPAVANVVEKRPAPAAAAAPAGAAPEPAKTTL